ncbi:hypothetical protein COT50_01255 [candidate division WWE3 bacterium CG08_land_8_20_14_0_20_41_10]|uniref:PIN domain-containing protein n=1 Tax=candidate division WWE3 bacterium CG08_land_8_20_14_0_20_41_10 TaxID=1975085 RepID=A0A2H0XEM3_UNCKA|nr:MAG: hypothetical protein COT50_01255 [candidate division WWE3 bacterium CG08_land_8_20_14_0_20_41_10]
MDKVVLDASLGIKWFLDEPESARAREILDDLESGKLLAVAPKLFILEVLNGCRYSGKYESWELKYVLDRLWDLGINFVDENDSLVREAISFADDRDLTIYDSVYMALAKINDCFLLTADAKHHKKEYWAKIKYL